MRIGTTIRQASTAALILCMALCVAMSCRVSRAQATTPNASPIVLDRVEAVVNNQAILTSDIENELRLAVLDPSSGTRRRPLTARRALQLLISRTLIQQQIAQGYVQAPAPTDAEIAARVQIIREQVPACISVHCTTDAGWQAFLKENDLTEDEVSNYVRLRLVVLAFIENRFRQGIQISHEEIEKYYNETLLPEYPKNQTPPPLKDVSPRIEEILLQQKVNVLFTAWLSDLRKQGEVEILDKALEPTTNTSEGDTHSRAEPV
jgi:peptidyl-prolyl cis-trans isomerase SurA